MDVPLHGVVESCQSTEDFVRTGVRPWTAGEGAFVPISATSSYADVTCRSLTQTEILSIQGSCQSRNSGRVRQKKRRYVFNIDLSGMDAAAIERSASSSNQEGHSPVAQRSSSTNDAPSSGDIRHLIREIRSVPPSQHNARCCHNGQSRVYNGARHKSKVIRPGREQRPARVGTSYTKQDNDQQKQLRALNAARASCRVEDRLINLRRRRDRATVGAANFDVDESLSPGSLCQQKGGSAADSGDPCGRRKRNNLAIVVCVNPQIGAFGEPPPVTTADDDDRATVQTQQEPSRGRPLLFGRVQSQRADGAWEANEVQCGDPGQVETASVDIKPVAAILSAECTTSVLRCSETAALHGAGPETELGSPGENDIQRTEGSGDTKERSEVAECCYNNGNINKATKSHNSGRRSSSPPPKDDNSGGARNVLVLERFGLDKGEEQNNSSTVSGENSLVMTLSCEVASSEGEGIRTRTSEEGSFADDGKGRFISDSEAFRPSFRKIRRESASSLAEASGSAAKVNPNQFNHSMSGLQDLGALGAAQNPSDDCQGLLVDRNGYADRFGGKELYPRIPSPPPSALKKRGSLTSASKKQRVKFDLDLEIHVVPRDSVSPTISVASDQEESLDFESPYSNSDLDDALEFKSITSPTKSLANEFDFSDKIAPSFESPPMLDRVAPRAPITPFRVISRASPVAGGRPASNMASYKARRDSLDMLQMQKFLKQQARDRALGSAAATSPSQGKSEPSRHLRTAPAAFPCRFVRHSSPSTVQKAQDRLLPRYAHVQIQRQVEELDYKGRRRHRADKHTVDEKPRGGANGALLRPKSQQSADAASSFLLGDIKDQLRRRQGDETSDPVPRRFFPVPIGSADFRHSAESESSRSENSERLPRVAQSLSAFPASMKTARRATNTAVSLPEENLLARGWPSRPHTSDPDALYRQGGARDRRQVNQAFRSKLGDSATGGAGQFHFAELSAGARSVLRDAHKAYAKTCSDAAQPVGAFGRRGTAERAHCGQPQRDSVSVGSQRPPRQDTKGRKSEASAAAENASSRGNAVTVSSLGLTAHTVRPRLGSSYSSRSDKGLHNRPLGLRRQAEDRPQARIAPVSTSPHRTPFARSSKLLLSIQKAESRAPAGSYRMDVARTPYANGARSSYDFRTNIIACDDAS